MTDPAYHIPISKDDLALIGEISTIQGQIDFLMQDTLIALLVVDRKLAQLILGAASMRTNADIWLETVNQKCRLPKMVELAKETNDEIALLTQGRNNFVHAVIAILDSSKNSTGFGFTTMPPLNQPNAVAVRTRNLKQTEISKIQETRDKAARVSSMLAHLNHEIALSKGHTRALSPWHGKF